MDDRGVTPEPRVWDRFMTERDRALLDLNWRKTVPFGLGQKPVLLVIDNYRGSLGDRPLPLLEAVKEWPNSCGEEGWEAVERTRVLLDIARSCGVQVVYTTNDPSGPPWGIPEAKQRAGLSEADWARRYEIVDEIEPLTADVVILKTSASGFFGTPMMSYLTHWGVDTVIVCGNSTSGCVRATTVDASSYRFKVAVVEDCCFDRTESTHAINLFDVHQKYADVMSSDEVAAYFKGLA